MAWVQVASSKLWEGIQAFQEYGSPFTDCVICVEGREFACHRLILSAYSDYFRAMFMSGMQEDRSGQVKLEGVSHNVFHSILEALYKGQDILDESYALEIWRVANMLQITCLQHYAEDFLLSHLTVENCIHIWKETHFSNVSSKVFCFILKEFPKIKSTEAFQTLDLDEIVQLVASDEINAPCEDEIVSAILHWVKKDEESRKIHISELLSLVRLKLVSGTFIAERLLCDENVIDNKEAIGLVRKALLYHSLQDRRHDECPPSVVHRKCSPLDNILVVMGRYKYEFYAYQLKTGKWFQLPRIPDAVGEACAACCYGEDIYVSGGGNPEKNSLCQFDISKNFWIKHASMNQGRFGHAQIAVGNCLYVLGGGYGNEGKHDSVECYDIHRDQWKVAGILHTAVRSPGVAVCGRKIIICGGKGAYGITKRIQCFDTESHTTCIIGPVPKKFTLLKPTCLYKGGDIYFVSQSGIILKLEEQENHKYKLVPCSPPLWRKCRRVAFGAAFYNDILFCVAGKVSNHLSLENREDVEVPGLCKHVHNLRPADLEYCFACFHTVIDKSYLSHALQF